MKNIKEELLLCKVCGWELESELFDVCSCCGSQNSYEDLSESSVLELRKEWLKKGAPWFEKSKKPSDWNLKEQLKRIGCLL